MSPFLATARSTAPLKPPATFVTAWDETAARLDLIVPPEEIADEHAALADAMTRLGEQNERLLEAARSGGNVEQVFEQIGDSDASADFKEAQCAIQEAGWEIIDPTLCPNVPDPVIPEDAVDGTIDGPGIATDPPEAFTEE